MRNAQFFYDLFAGLGVPANQIPFLVAQVAHETANFTDHKIMSHNNASGVTWTGMKEQNAERGNILPETRNDKRKYYYAKFNSIEDWAKNFLRILNRKPNVPIAADTVESFAAKLKANGYYTAPEHVYLKGLKFYLKKYGAITPSPSGVVPAILVGLVLAWLVL